jgi:hypothetical protein
VPVAVALADLTVLVLEDVLDPVLHRALVAQRLGLAVLMWVSRRPS